MNVFIISPLLTVAAIGMELLMLQFDFDGAAKGAGFITFLFVATAAVISALYSIFRGVKLKDLEAKINSLRIDVSDLTGEVAELTKKVATEKAEKLMKDAEIARLKRKLKDERKVTLSQAAKLECVPLPEDHYDEDCDV